MPSASITADLRLLAPGLARRFALIAAGLIAVIARGLLRHPRLIPLIIPLHQRIARASGRWAALMLRLAAGKTPRRPARRATRPADGESGGNAPEPRVRAPIRVPASSRLLTRTLGHQLCGCRLQLAQLLADPAAAALFAAAPIAAQILRPICRLLGLPPPGPQQGAAAGQAAAGALRAPETLLSPPSPPPARVFADDLPWITSPFPKRP